VTNFNELLSDAVSTGVAEGATPVIATDRWGMRPATIVVAGTILCTGQYDGEGFNGSIAVPIPITSLIGHLAQDARVMVLEIPPSGNYAIADLSGAEAKYNFSDTNDTTTATGSFTSAGATLVGTDFIVPASGRVKIDWGGEIANSGGNFTLVSPQIAEGSTVDAGTIVMAAGFVDTARADTTAIVRSTNFIIFDAAPFFIDPGTILNVALYHLTNGGTGTIARRRVAVVPV
jgi:hypothetical protein